jgi:DNA-binding NtrC family response regulator
MRASRILVVDDEADIRGLVQEILADEGYTVEVAANAAEARAVRTRSDPDLVLLDIWMPDTDGISLLQEWTEQGPLPCPVVMLSGHGTVETAMEATRLGAADFIEKPLSLAKLLHTVEQAIAAGNRERPAGLALVSAPVEPIGKAQAIIALRERVRRIAQHRTPVLFTGEAGSGRETWARYLHSMSSRSAGPFVNLVASTVSTAEAPADLFGLAEDGEVRPGVLEQAAGGTLFLNELDDLTPELQRLLAGVLDSRRYRTFDGEARELDIRLAASARPDIMARVEAGGVRRDLYTWLNVMTIQVPPLRDYREDVPELLRYYVDVLVDQEGLPYRRFGVAAQNRLRNYPWPGNVRELKNLVQRFLELGEGGEIGLKEVEAALAEAEPAVDEPLVKQDLLALPLREAREHFERAYLEQQLKLCGGRVGRLAERVGMERTHLYRKLNALGIDYRRLANGGEDTTP